MQVTLASLLARKKHLKWFILMNSHWLTLRHIKLKYSQWAGELKEVYHNDFNPRLGQKEADIFTVVEKGTGRDCPGFVFYHCKMFSFFCRSIGFRSSWYYFFSFERDALVIVGILISLFFTYPDRYTWYRVYLISISAFSNLRLDHVVLPCYHS